MNIQRGISEFLSCKPSVLLVSLFLVSCASRDDRTDLQTVTEKSCCTTPEMAEAACCPDPNEVMGSTEATLAATSLPTGLQIPDVELIDQDGKKVRFYTDKIQGKVVLLNFIFTTCTTICPPLTANFASVQKLMGDRVGRDVHLISVSVDPVNDTPPRLKAWSEKFGAKPGWSFLTGSKHDVDKLLKALRVFTPLKEDHSPLVILADEAKGSWTRVNGMASPSKLVELVQGMRGKPAKSTGDAVTTSVESDVFDSEDSAAGFAGAGNTDLESVAIDVASDSTQTNAAAKKYFTDVELLDHNGKEVRLYSDLIQGKIVIIGSFFASCTGVCPILCSKLQAVQTLVGNRLGKDVHIITISVDPLNDTPEVLSEYADRNQARPGWYFLTGNKENVDFALRKLGFWVEQRESHSNLVLIGNDRTGLWKKAFGLADTKEVLSVVQSVLDDKNDAEIKIATK